MKTSKTKTIQGKKLSKNNSDAIMKITGDSNEVWEIESIKLKRKDAEGVGMKQPTNKDIMNKLDKFIDYQTKFNDEQIKFNERIEADIVDIKQDMAAIKACPTIQRELQLQQ